MSHLYLPKGVTEEMRADVERRSAEVKDCIVLDREWTRRLKEIDPNLYMVRSKHWVKTGLPLVPGGCWHIIRDNSDKGAGETIIPLFENGEMMEPGSWVFDMLRRNDLQRPGALRERKAQEDRIEAAKERQRRVDRENRQAAILDRFKAGNDTRVSMDRTAPWTQSVRGKRGAKGK